MHSIFRQAFSISIEHWPMFKCSESSNGGLTLFSFSWINIFTYYVQVVQRNHRYITFKLLTSSEHSFFFDKMSVILKHNLLPYCLFSSHHCGSIFCCIEFFKCCWRISTMGDDLQFSLISLWMISFNFSGNSFNAFESFLSSWDAFFKLTSWFAFIKSWI